MWCIECSVGVVFFVFVAGGVFVGAAAEVPFAAVAAAVAAFAVPIVDDVVESVVVAPIDIAAAAATYIVVEFAKEPAAVAAVTATDLPLQPPLDELPLKCYSHSNQAMP